MARQNSPQALAAHTHRCIKPMHLPLRNGIAHGLVGHQ
jgi:hypothetical protein